MEVKTIQDKLFYGFQQYKNNIAIEYGDKKITYSELDKKSNYIANDIIEKGIGKGTFLGIYIEDKVELIASIIGIMKAGCVFIPLDTSYPHKRIENMIKTSEVKTIFTQGKDDDVLSTIKRNLEIPIETISVDKDFYSDKESMYETTHQIDYSPKDKIYIYFTSGTTGMPKAILGRNKSLLHFIDWEIDEFKVDETFRVSQFTNPGFDAFLRDTLVPLSVGATICIPSKEITGNSNRLVNWIDDEDITLIHCVPSFFQMFNIKNLTKDKFKNLKYILMSGEKINPQHIKNWYDTFNERVQLVNLYGATETTMIKTAYFITQDDINKERIPVGKPIRGSQIIVLDKDMKVCGVEEVGEVYIRTPFRTFGYYNNLELTKEKFIQNPFNDKPNDLIYRTGDLGMILPDGNLEVFGRIDHQVKIRGNRVELVGIENQLLRHEDIKETVVIAKENDNGEKYICAYIVSDIELTPSELRSHMSIELPEYMIPSYFVQIEKMPLTPNGKIDRNALPEPQGNIYTGVEYEEPRNEIEEKLVEIWKDILDAEKIGINDNFMDLGGHSLKAMVLASQIHKELDVEVPLQKVFRNPTIKSLSQIISKLNKSIYNSIEPVEEKEYYKVSSTQKRIYILQQFEGLTTTYNMPNVMEIEGEIDKDRLEKAFNKLIERHESLRTSFEIVNGEIIQRVHNQVNFKVKYQDLGDCEVGEVTRSFAKPFDLTKAPLIRVELIKIEDGKYILMTDMHHIVSDGSSNTILINDFVRIYEGKELENLRITYKDYSEWESRLFETEIINIKKEYWLEEFKGEIPVLDIPTDYSRPNIRSNKGDAYKKTLDKEVLLKLKKIAKENNTTLFTTLLAIYSITLSKYTGQEDISIGTVTAGRNNPELRDIIGVFLNNIAFRCIPNKEYTFKEYLYKLNDKVLKGFDNQEYPIEELIDNLNLKKDTSRNSLFDVMMILQNFDQDVKELKDFSIKAYEREHVTSKYDMTLYVFENESKGLLLHLEYSTDIFKEETIKRFINHLENITKEVVDCLDTRIEKIGMLEREEKRKILIDFNNTYTRFPKDKTIQEIFEEQVEKTPDNIALVHEDIELTYRELNEKSNQVARKLRQIGVEQEDIVGIMVDRSVDMIIGLLGVVKAGGAYLPIDPEYPQDRIKYMLEDSDTKILLTNINGRNIEKVEDNINEGSCANEDNVNLQRDINNNTDKLMCNIIGRLDYKGKVLDLEDEKIYTEDTSNLENINKPEDLLYVIYTSGSTGKPKGVMIEHRNLVNITYGWRRDFELDLMDVSLLQMASFSFDVFTGDFSKSLLNGGKMVICPKDMRLDPNSLYNLITKHNVNMFESTPALVVPFMEHVYKNKLNIDNLKLLIVGSDICKAEDFNKLNDRYSEQIRILNSYGVTETTIDASFFENRSRDIKVEKNVPIGKPMGNIQFYVLDKKNNIQPVGVYGELCISGDGVARGYLNKPELTKERFVENPFIQDEKQSKKMYRTGDIARWLPDGNIEFLGRVDNQVKIRGYRIEVGEIEEQLLKHEKVQEVAVVVKEDENGDKYLCSYIVGDEELTVSELKEYLGERLPKYMIPTYFINIVKIPLTANGKVDKKSLPEPEGRANVESEYQEASNETEEKLVEIWKDVLGVDKVGINDDFFELGGHSLKATTLVGKIHKDMNVEVPLKEIFKNPNIKEISQYINNTEKSIYDSIKSVEKKEYYQVSSTQKRMYILQEFEGPSISYNIPTILEIEGHIHIDKLKLAFSKLVERHEALRTSFTLVDGEIVQVINDSIEFEVEEHECREDEIKGIAKDFVKPFDLNEAPLIRVKLLKLENERYILMTDMHHIISDGSSVVILLDDFVRLYEGEELEDLLVTYKDYSAWENKMLQSKIMDKKKEYWMKKFSGELPVLNIPTDYPRPRIRDNKGDTYIYTLNNELVSKLKEIAKDYNTTLFTVLLSIYSITLSKYTGQEDIVIGTVTAGRTKAEIESIIGVFLNNIAIRCLPNRNNTFKEYITTLSKQVLDDFHNQEYPIEQLIDDLKLKKDTSRNSLFDVMLILQNFDKDIKQLPSFNMKPYEIEHTTSKYDMTLYAIENQHKELLLKLEYSTSIFKNETMERFINHFENIAEEISKGLDKGIHQMEILEDEEKERLLVDFNDTDTDYPKDKTIQEIFEEQVEKNPNKIAVVYEDNQLTYRELNEKSNQVARLLRRKGVKPETIVGIMLERSLEMIVGILGIIKAGGAYLPIDPEYPQDRIKYMLEDSGSNILVTKTTEFIKVTKNIGCIDKESNLDIQEIVSDIGYEGEIVDLANIHIYKEKIGNLDNINKPEDILYIIYTSGSTGRPKGVMVEHRNVINYISAFLNEFELTEKDAMIQQASFSFDTFTEELYPILIKGGRLVIPKRENILDAKSLKRIIEKHKATIISCSPLLLNELNRLPLSQSVRIYISGGDVLKREHISNIIKEEKLVYNTYGPTESTVCATYYRCGGRENGSIPIGKPISNYEVYIVDKNQNLLPIGIPGEICISGIGVSRGYLNKVELTNEKFIDNPYKKGEVIYRSGDLGRWLPDGNIEFLGRIDNQVKVRGYRIELGEIENSILSHKDIDEAVITINDDKNGEKYIVGYIVSDKEITVSEIREYLSTKVPDYMIPSYFVQIDNIPLTPNGKVDRKNLPKVDGNIDTGVEYEAPRNKTEEKLVEIWQDILGVDKVGINDDFFDLGGHSLKATTLVARIHKDMNVEVPLREVFKHTTIKRISEYIGKTDESIYNAIKTVVEREYYPLSSAQSRMYVLNQMSKDNTNYNITSVLELQGKLNIQKLEETFRKLIDRHESLRTSFKIIGNNPVQKVQESIDFNIEHYHLKEKDLKEIINSFIRPFDLKEAPLFRVGLIKVEDNKHILLSDIHHIISDGVSVGVLISEFAKIYSGEELPKLKIQYKDYTVWQQEMLQKEELKKQERYWLDKFQGELPVLNLPTDYKRPPVQSFEGDNFSFRVAKDIKDKLQEISKVNGATMYMTLLAAYNTLLYKYTGQEDIIIGSPIAGRPHADLENIIGMFVNTLAMKNHPAGDKTFNTLLKEVKENALKSYENQDYQFEELVDKLDIPRDTSRNPIFDTMFALLNVDNKEVDLENLEIKPYKLENKTSKFDISLNAVEISEGISFILEYSTKLFKKETIERLSRHFINIIEEISNNPEVKLKDIDILSEEEKHELLVDFNSSAVEYPKNKTLHQLFEEQVEKTPDNIALRYKEQTLTYHELNQRVNSLAYVLRSKGVKSETKVGIMLKRSPDMIIAILGILKAGGGYVPIDPEYPQDRIEYILNDSQTEILVTESSLVEDIEFDGEVIDGKDEKIYEERVESIENLSTSSNLAYIIYTSGSTGKPKGVMVEHRSVVNLALSQIVRFGIDEKEKVLQFSSICFDASVEQIFITLFSGATLVLIDKEKILDINKFEDYIIKQKVTHVHAVPTFLDNISPKREYTIKRIIAGGDVCPVELAKKWCEKYDFYNEYGPTETTVTSIEEKILNVHEEQRSLTIGKPIGNTKVYIIDNNNKLVPKGVAGELCIGGDGITRGYLNRVELTEEKFVDNPFSNDGSTKKIYKTGDLAKWLSNGNIEFLGRIDNQVKIRGFRIELGEIENQLLNYKDIKEVVVIAREDRNKNKYLCGYIVVKQKDIQLPVSELRKYLGKELPEYMIPQYFVQLDKMPLTTNGKVNRKLLPEPDGDINTGVEYEAPKNKTEEKLVEIWQDILGVEKVGINDNFFDLGGHSLKATTVIARIHKELKIEVPLQEIFKTPTIKGICEYISNSAESIYSSIKPVEEKEYYTLSSAQKRMYILNQFNKDVTNYNMPSILEIDGKVDIEKLENVFRELINRHESLRTSFKVVEEEPVQIVYENVDFEVEYIEKLNSNKENGKINRNIADIEGDIGEVAVAIENITEDITESIIKEFIRPFELSKAPLLRVGLVKISEEKYILMTDMHHIISDGVSMGIIVSEFSRLYNGKELPKLRIQYKDYAKWQQELLSTEKFKKQEKYWLERFQGELPVLELPTDYQRPPVQSFQGDSINFKVDNGVKESLLKIAKENKGTLYMTLLTAYNVLLYKYTEKENIIVGSPIAGRPHSDLENIIGMFVNTLAMRNYPSGNRTFKDILLEVRENALNAYENQDYQFEELVEKLDIVRDTSRNPIFDTMFSLQNISRDTNITKINEFKISSFDIENKISKFDISLNAIEGEEEIYFNLEYCTKLFRKETIERLSTHFVNILKEIIKNPEIKINEIELLSQEEKEKILIDFNKTKVEYPKEKTIHQLFEEQVEKNPKTIAVKYEDKSITYRELNDKSNQLARILKIKGVKSESIVGIMVERTIEMMIGVMAVLKAGGAYMPINPDYPDSRVKYMLEDSQTEILLTHDYLSDRKLIKEDQILVLEDKELYQGDSSNLEYVDEIEKDKKQINHSENPAYVIYTSGSTGKPKGVIVEHRALNNFLHTMYDKYDGQFDNGDNCLSLTNISFDVGVGEIFLPLVFGSTLVFLDSREMLDISRLVQIIIDEEITFAYIPPTILTEVYELLEGQKDKVKLNKMLVGVEPIKDFVLENYLKLNEGMKVINGYGPTEATICATMYTYGDEEPKGLNVPIGKPLNNTQIYILDKYNNPVPIGVAGELCVSGDGLAKEYINKLRLTKEKFVDDPFCEGKRMYKTGDLAKWNSDGNIQFIGRVDNQVKIRGHRIELGEIENQLLTHDFVKEVVVIDREDDKGNKYLCGYVVINTQLSVSKLREYLKQRLPEYMIPSYFIEIDEVPLTPNGKIDKKVLPQPEGIINTGVEYEEPRNDIDERVLEIWKKLLGVKKIGINDNFFDLGGHSLKAMILKANIHKEFNVELPLNELFKNPTIKEIGNLIIKSDKTKFIAIEKIDEQDFYELSYNQKRLWIINNLNTKGTSYNMPFKIMLEEEIDKDHIIKTFNKLVERHESLRTGFIERDGMPVQFIKKDVSCPFRFIDISGLDILDKDEEVEKLYKEEANKVFDLSNPPLITVVLIKIARDRYCLIANMHHIITDGWSITVLKRDFYQLYQGYKNGKEVNLKPLDIQYKDFVAWQNKLLSSETVKNNAHKFWSKKLENGFEKLQLPYDYKRDTETGESSSYVSFVNEETLNKVRDIAKESDTTIFSVLFSMFNILISDIASTDNVICGIPSGGREDSQLNDVVGFFVNTLVLQNNVDKSQRFIDMMEEINKNTLETLEYQSYPLELILEDLNINYPDISVFFNMLNIDLHGIENRKEEKDRYYIEEVQDVKFDLVFYMVEYENGIEINCHYKKGLFKLDTIKYIVEKYSKLIQYLSENVNKKIKDYRKVLREERLKEDLEIERLREERPSVKKPKELLVDKFEKVVSTKPSDIAVKTYYDEITYEELNNYGNHIARMIIEGDKDKLSEARDSEKVGLLFGHGIDMIVGLVGALKARRIYVPLDGSYPENRLEYMIEHSEVSTIITNDDMKDLAINLRGKSHESIQIISIDEIDMTKETENIKMEREIDDITYILYTSGSTSKPKGVIQKDENISHFVEEYTRKLNITDKDKLTLFSSFSHDASVMDIYTTLLNGATLYPMDLRRDLDFLRLKKFIEKEGITVWHSVPTLYRKFISQLEEKELSSVKNIVLGGEEVILDDIEKFQNKFVVSKLYNLYGQTESSYNSGTLITTTDSIHKITLGECISGIKLLVIDEDGNRVEPLGIGEIVIAGEHISLGYWKEEELTDKVFGDHETYGRLYRTGDQGRLLLDGTVEFMGRKDSQVKIRGYRVELGEIQSRMLKHKDIEEAVVISKEDENKDKFLIGYLVSQKELKVSEIRDYLSRYLPDYMIPAHFAQIDKLPLLPNGKLDRNALSELKNILNNDIEYVPPSNNVEEKLVEIWKRILSIDVEIGIKDKFFELGGHSLKAMDLVSEIHKELEVKVPLLEIFNRPTIETMGEYILNAKKVDYQSIEKAEEKKYYPLSSAQNRMYILNQFNNSVTNYNMTSILEINGFLDVEQLNKTFAELIERHESLRTSFHMEDGKPVQRVHKQIDFEVEYHNLEELNSNSGDKDYELLKEQWIENIATDFVRPFDLSKAPLLRVGLLKITENSYILITDMHHIISDGSSIAILIKEFSNLYNGKELPQFKIQYKDYAIWQNNKLNSEELKKQERYWVDKFNGEIPLLNLKTDYHRPTIEDFQGNSISFQVDKNIKDGLHKLSEESNATLYMALLTAYNVLLHKYTGQDDIIIGSPIAGRHHSDLQNIIGMFVNTLAMRNYPQGGKTFKEFLAEVKDNALEAYENQDYQFEELVSKLNLERDTSRNPLFDTVFTLQNMDIDGIELEDINITPYDLKNRKAKFDIALSAMEGEEGIYFTLNYSTTLFNKEMIERMTKHLQNVLFEVVDNPNIELNKIDMLTKEEKRKLLLEFNDTEVNYKKYKCLYQLFEEQVEKSPNTIALIYGDDKLTYKELNDRSNNLARKLRKEGVGRDKIVGIKMERSIEMIIGIMAILKSGGAYLPIDNEYPEDRVKYMLEDSNCDILIGKSKQLKGIKSDIKVIDIENIQDCEIYDGSNLKPINELTDLAYIIYTSGSTGKPKGVMIEHRNILNTILWRKNELNLDESDNVLQLFSFAFDGFLISFFTPIVSGSCAVLLNDQQAKNPIAIKNIIVEEGITHFISVPALYDAILECSNEEELQTLRMVSLGADKVTNKIVTKSKKKNKKVEIINEYGPTENSVVTTIERDLQETCTITIGHPISNTKVYILDNSNNLVPIGVPGELCISGNGLARGYLKRDDLTQEKFIENPFNPNERLYKTGDLARWLPNGSIDFLSRIDHQVKIRGYRIELGEIERYLLKHDDIKEAVVIAKETADKENYICGYIVGNRELSTTELRAYLSEELPAYMIPAFFIQLEKIPVNNTGKVDKNALPDVKDKVKSETKYEAPRNKMEETLVEIWKDILQVDRLGINDSFFEIGGHSLKLLTLAVKIKEEFGIELSLEQLMKNVRIKDISTKIIGEFNKKDNEPIVLLNEESNKKVFCFPPIAGFAIAYKELSILLDDCAVYSFNYLEDENILKKYVDIITDIQKDGPYVLLGHSAGGRLAFHIAKELETQGYEVSDIIILDAYRETDDYSIDSEKGKEKRSQFETKLSSIIESNEQYKIFRESITRKVTHYHEFILSKRDLGNIDGNIHFITSETMRNQGIKNKDWEGATRGQYLVYNGYGEHEDMINEGYVEKNGEIIKKILDKNS